MINIDYWWRIDYQLTSLRWLCRKNLDNSCLFSTYFRRLRRCRWGLTPDLVLRRRSIAVVQQVVADGLAGAVLQQRGLCRRRPGAHHHRLALHRPSLHPPRHRCSQHRKNMMTVPWIFYPKSHNRHNLISEEVRGAARAEITGEKPPKLSGSIAKVTPFIHYRGSVALPAAAQFSLRHFINDIFPKISTT